MLWWVMNKKYEIWHWPCKPLWTRTDRHKMFFETWINIISNANMRMLNISLFASGLRPLDLCIVMKKWNHCTGLHFLEISLVHTLEDVVSTLIILQRLRSADIYHLTLMNFTFTAEGNHFHCLILLMVSSCLPIL